jgi:WS/DGAT/MGAT family acyltransferase
MVSWIYHRIENLITTFITLIFGARGEQPMAFHSETMSNVDAAWLSMDDPTNLMMITGVMTFAEPINLDHFRAVITHRWLKFDRFSQHVVQPRTPGSKPRWETDPKFDLDAHIHRVALPAPGDHAALQAMVSDLASMPLDPSKALWQATIIENYEGGSALVVRLHHSIADGLALVYVLLALTDMTPDAPWPKATAVEAPPENAKSPGPIRGVVHSVFGLGRKAIRTGIKTTSRVVQEGWDMVTDMDLTLGRAQQGTDAAYALTRLTLRTPDPETPFKGSLGVSKRAAWSDPVPLRDVKVMKNAAHTTVNDVLVAAMSGALRRYLLDEGAHTADFRAVIPVNMRTTEELGKLGNKFGIVFLSLPVSIADPMERLQEVSRRMDALKGSSEALVALGILNGMGISPSEIQKQILTLFASKATAVLTNVPGPPVPLFLAGREIQDIMFWVPQSGRLGLGISLLSYAGKVYAGVITDAGLVPDPERIIAYYEDELEVLKTAVLTLEPPQFTRPKPPRDGEADDLSQIQGIDAETAVFLNEQGVFTFAQMGGMTATRLETILARGNGRFDGLNPTNWPAQACYLLSLR